MQQPVQPTMRAVVFDGQLRFAGERPAPTLASGWARIRVTCAGICRTDLEITRGYLGFEGVLGHEFVGVVDQCDDARWVGKRVVGEINAACGGCPWCARGLGRHCPNRQTLGIRGLDGCLADWCVLPQANLVEVPPSVGDEPAVFVEPLSAACEILEQVPLSGSERVAILGDGRLGILCAWVLATALDDVTIVGRHPHKLAAAEWRRITTALSTDEIATAPDIVVEATGSAQGVVEAMALCRPRGTIVLKSTVAGGRELNLSPLVVDEQTIVGSRCGRSKDGLAVLQAHPDMPLERLITATYAIEQAEEAFQRAAQPDALKVLLRM